MHELCIRRKVIAQGEAECNFVLLIHINELCDYSWQCYAGVKDLSKIRAEPVPGCGRKLSQDLSVDKNSTVDSLDSDVAIIDVGSPSSEQYKASDKTPSVETKKRGLDAPVVQSEFKVGTYKIHTIIVIVTYMYTPSSFTFA